MPPPASRLNAAALPEGWPLLVDTGKIGQGAPAEASGAPPYGPAMTVTACPLGIGLPAPTVSWTRRRHPPNGRQPDGANDTVDAEVTAAMRGAGVRRAAVASRRSVAHSVPRVLVLPRVLTSCRHCAS